MSKDSHEALFAFLLVFAIAMGGGFIFGLYAAPWFMSTARLENGLAERYAEEAKAKRHKLRKALVLERLKRVREDEGK